MGTCIGMLAIDNVHECTLFMSVMCACFGSVGLLVGVVQVGL